jgi:hypothetical protein
MTEYFSYIKKNEITSFAGKWVKLAIKLSEISCPTKTNIHCFLSYVEICRGKDIKVKRGTARDMEVEGKLWDKG